MELTEITHLNQPIKPIGFWNNINPFTKSNKFFKEQQKLWIANNSTHIDKIKWQIKRLLRGTSHLIGVFITVFFTTTPWIWPYIDYLIGIGTLSNNGYQFSWPDHLVLTALPLTGHLTIWLLTRRLLGAYGQIIKFTLIMLPIILTLPYLIYQLYQIWKHKSECSLCAKHSNKITKEV